jgi:protease-4
MNKDMKMIAYMVSFVFVGAAVGFVIGSFFQISTANIAIINIDSQIDPYGGLGSLTSDDVISLLNSAETNPNVGAVILSINSPGGAVVSTMEIVSAVKKFPKPIVALIRDIGASGAYWIASACDMVVASPLSLTGSIGVTSTYLEYSGLFEKYGINYVNLSYPMEKDILTSYREISDEERAYMMDVLNTTYWYFVSDVAQSRNMTFEEVVESSGNGTVLLGKRAYEVGLVDSLGDMDTAILLASQMAGIESPETQVFQKTSSIADIFSWLYSGLDFNGNRIKLET